MRVFLGNIYVKYVFWNENVLSSTFFLLESYKNTAEKHDVDYNMAEQRYINDNGNILKD